MTKIQDHFVADAAVRWKRFQFGQLKAFILISQAQLKTLQFSLSEIKKEKMFVSMSFEKMAVELLSYDRKTDFFTDICYLRKLKIGSVDFKIL